MRDLERVSSSQHGNEPKDTKGGDSKKAIRQSHQATETEVWGKTVSGWGKLSQEHDSFAFRSPDFRREN